ncbi:MAG: response regulator transcription factor [Alphaproteobacteria bacterium]|nr:response regulator transcription factor [Alphaproteobacteria bacterium]
MNTKKYKILLCEDDPSLGMMVKDYLENQGFDVVLEGDGRLGWAAFQKNTFDICLLDIMMPNLDGFTLAEMIREQDAEVLLLFLTAKSQLADKRKGYLLGADEYITKPFDPEELLLKINAKLRRIDDDKPDNNNYNFTIGNFSFNSKLRILENPNQKVTLTPKENELLKLLIENFNDLVPREKALKKIWGGDTYFNGRSMDVYIAKLRKTLKDDPKIEIVNIHGEGFRLVDNHID